MNARELPDFDFFTAGPGLYTLTANSDAALDRLPEGAVFDDTRLANDCAGGLLEEGFTVSLDGRPLMLA